MKRFLLSCLVVSLMCSGLYADKLEDNQFRQYVELTKNSPNNPEGMSVTADYTYRIIYVTLPLALNKSSVTSKVMSEMKEAMIQEMKKEKEDCKVIKDLKIYLVFTYITSDKNLVSISLSYKDLY